MCNRRSGGVCPGDLNDPVDQRSTQCEGAHANDTNSGWMDLFESGVEAVEPYASISACHRYLYCRDVYDASHLGELMSIEPKSVTRTYIRTGRIKAKKGKMLWEVGRDEFLRVAMIVTLYGNRWL